MNQDLVQYLYCSTKYREDKLFISLHPLKKKEGELHEIAEQIRICDQTFREQAQAVDNKRGRIRKAKDHTI